jgi:hypothetical protein
MMATWRGKITVTMGVNGDSWAEVEACTLSESELDEKFNAGFGSPEGEPFTVWTKSRVYFPLCYDGSEWCGSVARHPDGKPTDHQGGG